jgi:hypothetical protein
MRQCRHNRRGIVTNQPDGYDASRPHAARSVCDRTECIEAAKSWVAARTNETAVHVRDSQRRQRPTARDGTQPGEGFTHAQRTASDSASF